MYIKDDIPFSTVSIGPAGLKIIFVSIFWLIIGRICLGSC